MASFFIGPNGVGWAASKARSRSGVTVPILPPTTDTVGIVGVMSTEALQIHKGVDGKAVLTDTHLIFEYNVLALVLRGTKRSEIPLHSITGYEVVHGEMTYLRVFVDGKPADPDPSKSKLAIALHPRKSHLEFVDALKRSTGAEVARSGMTSEQMVKAAQPPELPSGNFGGYKLREGVLKGGGKSVSVQGAEAEATQGAPSQRSTLTRMGAGALIAGPIGFVVGAVARKNTSKCYVTIEVPDGVVIIEAKANEYPEAVAFANAINRSAAAVR